MKNATKDKLFEAWAYCDEEDKSTEFMLQYMQDSAKVNLDTVLKFIETTSDSDRRAWYKKQLTDTVSRIINGMSEKELIEYIDEQDDIRDSAMEEVYKAENIDDFQWLSELVSIPVRVANRRLRSIQSEFELSDIPDYGDHMTFEEFKNCCNSGGFIDYDGSGNYATDSQESNISVYPSDIASGIHRKDFSHVVWYNR